MAGCTSCSDITGQIRELKAEIQRLRRDQDEFNFRINQNFNALSTALGLGALKGATLAATIAAIGASVSAILSVINTWAGGAFLSKILEKANNADYYGLQANIKLNAQAAELAQIRQDANDASFASSTGSATATRIEEFLREFAQTTTQNLTVVRQDILNALSSINRIPDIIGSRVTAEVPLDALNSQFSQISNQVQNLGEKVQQSTTTTIRELSREVEKQVQPIVQTVKGGIDLGGIERLINRLRQDIINLLNANTQDIEENLEQMKRVTFGLETTFTGNALSNQISDTEQRLTDLLSPLPLIPANAAALKEIKGNLNTVKDRVSPEALANAAATGVCKTVQPGGCLRKQFDKTNSKIDGLQNGINNAGLTGLAAQAQLNHAATQAQIASAQAALSGQLSSLATTVGLIQTKLVGLATWLGIDRLLNILNLWATIHNAYFLSSNLAQTLFSTIDNVLQIFNVELKDDEGDTIGVGGTIANALDSYMRGVFGVTTWEGIKTQWKLYSRIYSAASNIIFSLRSIGDSILSALEVTASWVASIGNAMKRAGAVAERAFGWMNPQPNFQNRFFTALERTEEFVSSVDQIAGEVLNIQQTSTEIVKSRQEMKDAIAQLNNAPQGPAPPEADQTKEAEGDSKAASASPPIDPSDLISPGG